MYFRCVEIIVHSKGSRDTYLYILIVTAEVYVY